MRDEDQIQKEVQKLIAAVGSKTSLPRDGVVFALELAIEQAVCEFFKVPECQVDIEDKSVAPIFQNLSSMETDKTDKTLPNIVSDVPFGEFSKNIIKHCRKLFFRNLSLMESAHLYEKWKCNVHQAVQGFIDRVDSDKAEIHIGDNVLGVMLKSEWVPKEIPLYRPGAVFWFYVNKLVESKSAVTVYLSRGSKNLPAALFKEKLPWAKFRVLKRIRGEKTWLNTSVPVDREVIAEVRLKLKGEVIEIQKADL